MFSALRFVAASVIVALFGGFLLQGMFTMQSEEMPPAAVSASPTSEATVESTEAPTTSVRSDILPGVELHVEEVEPGVFHVISDGLRDIVLGGNTDIVAGHDDGIWLLRKNQFVRLGSEAGHGWPEAGGRYHAAFEVTPDGTVWVLNAQENTPVHLTTLLSSSGDGWTPMLSPSDDVFRIEAAHDGTLWASWVDERGSEDGYLGPDGWQPLGSGWAVGAARLHPTDSGVLYIDDCAFGGCIVKRHIDGAWQDLPEISGGFAAFDVAPDGTVWLLDAGTGLVRRFAGDAWVSWTPDGLPDIGLGIALDGDNPYGPSFDSTFMAAPDGSIWASLWQRGPDGEKPPAGGMRTFWGDRSRYDPQCDGLLRFDGETTDRFLPGRCTRMDIAADGSVWVLADDRDGKDLYVITPEALAGTR